MLLTDDFHRGFDLLHGGGDTLGAAGEFHRSSPTTDTFLP